MARVRAPGEAHRLWLLLMLLLLLVLLLLLIHLKLDNVYGVTRSGPAQLPACKGRDRSSNCDQ